MGTIVDTSKMKIAVFGATGQTGFPLLEQALSDPDIKLKALVRNVEKLRSQMKENNVEENESLQISAVDLSSDNLAEELHDVDVVISALGFPVCRPSTKYLEFTKSIVAAMNKTGSCRRLILLHSWFTEETSRPRCPFYIRWTLLKYIGCLLDDMRNAEKYLQNGEENPECKDIDFTAVLVGGLVNKPVTDSGFLAVEDDWYVDNASSWSISRADVARYLLNTAKHGLHSRKIVAVASTQVSSAIGEVSNIYSSVKSSV